MSLRLTLDSNILVYAELEPESGKGQLAQRLIERAAPRGVLAVQALLEYLAVVRRRRPENLPGAMAKVEIWSTIFETAPTTDGVVRAASALVRRYGFRMWDAVIWCAAETCGARVFLSEDLRDGLELGALRVLNPFAADAATVRALLSESSPPMAIETAT